MSDVERQIREKIDAFVNELTELVREEAMNRVSEAFGGQRAAARGRRAGRPAAPAAARGRRKGQKRSPKELDRLVGDVRGYVNKKPGQGVEQMARDLGVNSRDLVLPIKKLIAGKEIRTRGQKRATKYFPGGGRRAAKA